MAVLLAAAAGAGVGVASIGGGSSSERRVGGATSAAEPTARTQTSSAQTSSTRRTETAGKLAPAVSQPAPSTTSSSGSLANARYVLGRTHLVVNRTGKVVTNFFVQERCAQGITLPAVLPIKQGGFDYSGIVSAKPYTKATIVGRFVGTTARLKMRFTSPGCDSGTLRRTLRRS